MSNSSIETSLILSGLAGVTQGAVTGSAVLGQSAAGIMAVTSGTTGAAIASLFGASGTAGAAAISSGMAAVGGTMATGAIITAAAPVALGIGAFALLVGALLDD